MAKIYEKRGRWCVDYTGADGRRHRDLLPLGATKTLAKDILAKKQAEAIEMRHFPARAANSKLFGEVLTNYWELHGKNLESKSWWYELKEFEREFGKTKIGAIGSAEIQRFYNRAVAKNCAATANKKLTLLKSIFNKAKVYGYFYGDNPCNQVKKQIEVSQRRRYLSLDEIDRLLENSHPRLYPVVVCALMTGMRRGEIRNLSWENIDWERGIIHIRKAKSGRAREVPIASKLREVLAGLSGERVGSTFKLPDIMLTRFFARALRDAAITDFVFHDLRHTFASHFLMRTHNLPALQSLLGHSTPLLTLRYAHLSRPHIQEGMALFEAGMAQPRIMPPAPTPGIYQVEHVQ